MDKKKSIVIFLILLLGVASLASTVLGGNDGENFPEEIDNISQEWQTENKQYIKSLEYHQGTLYSANTGGLTVWIGNESSRTDYSAIGINDEIDHIRSFDSGNNLLYLAASREYEEFNSKSHIYGIDAQEMEVAFEYETDHPDSVIHDIEAEDGKVYFTVTESEPDYSSTTYIRSYNPDTGENNTLGTGRKLISVDGNTLVNTGNTGVSVYDLGSGEKELDYSVSTWGDGIGSPIQQIVMKNGMVYSTDSTQGVTALDLDKLTKIATYQAGNAPVLQVVDGVSFTASDGKIGVYDFTEKEEIFSTYQHNQGYQVIEDIAVTNEGFYVGGHYLTFYQFNTSAK